MARIEVKTVVPPGTEVAYARRAARLEACDKIPLHVVEETLLPTFPKVQSFDPDGRPAEVDSPNDHTVERVLTTWWDIL